MHRLQMLLGFPPPDVVYPTCFLHIIHNNKNLLSWTSRSILEGVMKEPPIFTANQCPIALLPEWRPKSNNAQPSQLKYDWSYSSTFDGIIDKNAFVEGFNLPVKSYFDKENLKERSDAPIIFATGLIFYEDELGDFGKSIFSLRMRITTKYLFILTRSWVELPLQGLYRSIENRWVLNTRSDYFVHRYTIKELASNTLKRGTDLLFKDIEASQLQTCFEKESTFNF